jgi:tetratricopeptide (TPR) repeat protein
MPRLKAKKEKTDSMGKEKDKDKKEDNTKDDKKDGTTKTKKKNKLGLGMLGGMMRKKGGLHDSTVSATASLLGGDKEKDKDKDKEKEKAVVPTPKEKVTRRGSKSKSVSRSNHKEDVVPKSPRSPKSPKESVGKRTKKRITEAFLPHSSPMRGGGGGPLVGDDHMENSNSQLDYAPPPIGEIVATMPSDAVSELPEHMDGGGIEDALDEDEIVYNPEDFDVCFDNRHHPGTKEWIQIVRDSLAQFATTDYSPPVYKAIKKKLKGRRFLIRISRNSKTSWREATKPEVIELFGECFNEEKRRKKEGILEDASDVDSSLQNSAQQSEESLSIGNIMEGEDMNNDNNNHNSNNKPKSNNTNNSGRPPKPKTNSERNRNAKPSDQQQHNNNNNNNRNGNSRHNRNNMASAIGGGGGMARAEGYLDMAVSECQGAQEYAKPFDNMTQLQKGISAEQKLITLLKLAAGPNMTILKKELDHLEDLSKRMRYASMAPLLETLENVEKHMTEYFQAMGEHASQSDLKQYSQRSLSSRRAPTPTPTPPPPPLPPPPPDNSSSNNNNHKHTSHENGSGGKYQNDFPPESPARHASHTKGLNHQNNDGGAVHGNRSIPVVGSPASPRMRKTVPVRSAAHDDDLSVEDSPRDGEMQSPSQLSDSEYDQYERGSPLDSNAYQSSPGGPLLNDDHDDDDHDEEGDNQDEAEYDELEVDDDGNLIDRDEVELGDSANVGGEVVGSVEQGHDGRYSQGDSQYGDHGSQALREEGNDSYIEGHGSSGYLGSSGHLGGSKASSKPLSGLSGMNAHILELRHNQDDVSSVGRSQGPMDGYSGRGSQGEDEEEEEFTEVDGLDEADFEDGDAGSDFSSKSGVEPAVEEPVPQEDQGPPNPKIEAFFDRLRHFMEVRRKVDEKASSVDPSDKIKGLKMKLHSGGIEKKSGKFKKEFQQQDLKGKLVRSLDDIYEAATKAEPALKKLLQQITKDVKGLDSDAVYMGPLKTRDRAFQKAKQEYSDRKPGPAESWLYDIVRGSIVCKTFKQISEVNKWLGKNAFVITAKNRFETPAFNGYRDLIYHLSIPYKGDLAHICEIQVHHKELKVLDEQYGLPTHMEYFRSSFAGPWRTQDETMDDLVMLNDFGAIGGKLMSKLMRSKNPDQLRLFAGICHEKLDEFTRALELYRRLLILQEDTFGKNHECVARTFQSIGLVQGHMGETEESLMNLQKALAIQESILGKENLEVAESYSEIGHMLTQKGDFQGALKHYRTAMDIREAKLGSDHLMMVTSLQEMACALTEKGDYKEAVDELTKALKIQVDALGEGHNDVSATHELLGRTLCVQGDFKRAMKELEMAIATREGNLGKNHPLTAESHTDIGIVLCQQGDYEIAEWRHRKALRIREAMRGKDHEDCAVSYTHLGDALCRKGDYENALKEINRAMEIREVNLGRDHPLTANSYIDLGNVLCKMGEYEEALAEFRRAMVIHESILGELHPDTATSYNAIGRALQLMGRHDQALSELRRAVSIFETIYGKNHPRTAMGYSCIADTMLAMGDKDEALIQHRRALSIRANVLAKDHPDTQKSCTAIGGLLLEKCDLVGALVAYRQALAITVGLSGEEHPETAVAHMNVGRVLTAQEDYDIALYSFKKAALIREAALGENDFLTGESYSMLGSVYNMLDMLDEAEEYHAKAAKIRASAMDFTPIDDVSDPSEFSDYDE